VTCSRFSAERLLPASLHRAGLVLAHWLRLRWWRWRKPLLRGCQVLATDGAGRVLLVRHSYGRPHWTLPGGGLRAGEDPLLAAVRELAEETGCVLSRAALVAVIEEIAFGTVNHVHVVRGRARGELIADGREIVEAAFFPLDALPDRLARGLAERLPEWLAAGRI